MIQKLKKKKIDRGLYAYSRKWNYANSVIDAAKSSDAIILITEWQEFREIRWEKIYEIMRIPAWIFDTRNICNVNDLKALGFLFSSLGKPKLEYKCNVIIFLYYLNKIYPKYD